MNKKIITLFYLPFAVLVFTLALVFVYEPGEAQTSFTYTKPNRCAAAIPLGSAEMETFYIIEDLFKSFKTLQNYLRMVENVGLELVGVLNANRSLDGDPVCDFNKCKANDCYFGDCQTMAIDQGSEDIDLSICVYQAALCKEVANMCVSLCKELPCVGDPCPILGDVNEMGVGGGFLQTLRVVQSGISDEHDAVERLFQSQQVKITHDIFDARQKDKIGTTVITRIEQVERLLGLARAWLTPWSGDSGTTPTCALNARERQLLEQGKQLPREPMSCRKALKEGIYWPPSTSPFCEKECKGGLNDVCQNCLENNCAAETQRKVSWLADFNCQFFSDCQASCLNKASLDLECYTCLCQGFVGAGGINDGLCQDWLCAGSVLNFVCCE